MKKILLCLSFVFLSACTSPVDTSTWDNYQNSFYHFQVSYPKDYSYCLNDYCFNEIPEDVMGTFYLLDEFKDISLTVQPYKNELGMSAMEYGALAADYNEGVSDIETITFAGQDALAFTTESSFLEPGGVRGATETGYISLTYNADATELPSVNISEKSRVIYVDFGDYFYRIVYSDDEKAKTLLDTFKFIE